MKKILNKNAVMAGALYLLGFGAFFYLYKMQAEGIYLSDLYPHISSALRGGGYSLLSVVYRGLYALCGDITLILIVLAAAELGFAILLGTVMKRILEKKAISLDWGAALILGFFMLFVCKIYVPLFSPVFYKTSFVTQPWHNQTYLLMRIPALLSVLYYFKLEKKYLQHLGLREAVVFTLLLSLTNAIKPNFILFFSLMMLVYLMIDFVRTRGKGGGQIIKFGSCVLFSLGVVLWQSTVLFPSGGEGGGGGGIAFSTEKVVTFFSSAGNIVGMMISMVFPVLTLVWAINKNSETKELRKVWIMFIIAVLESFLLIETGGRAGDGNFVWGRYCAGFFLYFFSFIKFLELSKKYPAKTMKEKVFPVVGGCFMGLSIFCGIIYFVNLVMGSSYEI